MLCYEGLQLYCYKECFKCNIPIWNLWVITTWTTLSSCSFPRETSVDIVECSIFSFSHYSSKSLEVNVAFLSIIRTGFPKFYIHLLIRPYAVLFLANSLKIWRISSIVNSHLSSSKLLLCSVSKTTYSCSFNAHIHIISPKLGIHFRNWLIDPTNCCI